MRFILSGGGTGGHLYPAIAVAEELQRQGLAKKEEILFVGTDQGIEKRVIPKEGYAIKYLKVSGFVGKPFLKKLLALFQFLLSFYTAFKILKRFRPDAVIGSGGYASLTMVIASSLKGIPTIALEQNSVPGLSNRLLGRFVDALCLTYEDSFRYFPKEKSYHTGNPIRAKILKKDIDKALELFPIDTTKKTILVFGGSSGAVGINSAVIDALPYLLDLKLYIQFIHQSGDRDFDRVTEQYKRCGFKALTYRFIDQIAEAYTLADLVICRAGATTLSEITVAGKAAILIPYPYAASNHQEKNALRLEAMNAAKVLREDSISGELLASVIREILIDTDKYKRMQEASSQLGKPDAAEKVVHIIDSLINRKKTSKRDMVHQE